MLGTSNFRTMQVSCAQDRSSAAPAAFLTEGCPSCDVSDRLRTRQAGRKTLFSAFHLEFDDSGANGKSRPQAQHVISGPRGSITMTVGRSACEAPDDPGKPTHYAAAPQTP
jgi:hypothetical protein